jgi:hypothetical protein
MKIEAWKNKTEFLTRALVAVAALLVAVTFLKVGFFVNSSNAMMMVAQADPNKAGPDDVKKLLAETKARADEIKKNNLFVPGLAKQNPVHEVIGILGREALIGDKWYKVGDRVGDARIVAIEPTKVKVAWDGKEQEFSPIGSSGAGGRGGPEGLSGRGAGPGGAGRAGGAGGRRGLGRGGAGNSADMDKLREQWVNASPEEKQRLREEMRQKGGARGQ